MVLTAYLQGSNTRSVWRAFLLTVGKPVGKGLSFPVNHLLRIGFIRLNQMNANTGSDLVKIILMGTE